MITVLITSISGCIVDTDDGTLENSIVWINTPPAESGVIEKKIIQQVIPYAGMEYANITVSASRDNNKLCLHVAGVLANAMHTDLYDFSYNYHNKELTRVSYILEAIPEPVRGEAIGIAMQDEHIKNVLSTVGAYGNPSVKRILPETAEKFYEPKTLISVTWKDIPLSALVDVDTGQVVQVWNGD